LDKICDGQHSNKFLQFAVPERGGPDSVVNKGEEGFADWQFGVEDHQLGTGRDDVIALVGLHEEGIHGLLAF